MRYLGIDYGTKRVGVALSDESNTFALPLRVIETSKRLVDEVNDIVCENEVGTIVLGESKDFKGKDNVVMGAIRIFKEELENKVGKLVVYEPEFLTSHHAARVHGNHALLDASAAALILQSYLDRLKNN